MERNDSFNESGNMPCKTSEGFLKYAKIPILVIDELTTIIQCNSAFELLTGYTKNEIEGNTWTGFIADESDLKMMLDYQHRRRIDPASVPEEYEFVLKTKTGGRKNIALSITMHTGTKRSITFLQDITEKKRSEIWYRAVFENTGLPSIIVDSDTTIIKANMKWTDLSGYSLEEIEGKMSWKSVVHEDDLERVLSYHDNRRKNIAGIPSIYDFRFITRNGEIRNMINNVGMIPDSVYSIASFMDITDLRELEKERSDLEDQLQQSSKLETIGQLAGGIAHDFNNMLAAIMGYSQLAQIRMKNFLDFFKREKSELNNSPAVLSGIEMVETEIHNLDKAYSMIGDVIKASQRAGGLTRQLLAFARKQTLDVKPLDLNRLIGDLKKMLRHTIRENIEIEISLSDDLGFTEADESQMEQIILNLSLNAQDAMPSGGRLIISTSNTYIDESFALCHEGAVPGHYVMIKICDTGSGIDSALKKKIFEPFFTTKEKGKGTGLGLATVYGIVKQHRGYIDVESESGKGTEFRIYLPCSVKQSCDNELAVPLVYFPSNETILIVEDHEQVREITSKILKEHGYNILAASSGHTAIEAAASYNGKIHLLLSDVILPGMNGRDLYKALLKVRPDMESLFLSGYPGDIISHQGILEDGVNFLFKPVLFNDLLMKIHDILDRNKKP